MEAWPFTEEVTEYLRKAERTELGRWGRNMGLRMCLAGFVTNKASKTGTAWGRNHLESHFMCWDKPDCTVSQWYWAECDICTMQYISPICCYHMWSWPSHMRARAHMYHMERWTLGICAMCFDLETCCYSSHPSYHLLIHCPPLLSSIICIRVLYPCIYSWMCKLVPWLGSISHIFRRHESRREPFWSEERGVLKAEVRAMGARQQSVMALHVTCMKISKKLQSFIC